MSIKVISMREEIHDDQGRNAVKSVPVYRVKFVSKSKDYSKKEPKNV